MYTKVVKDVWDESTAGGAPQFQRYEANPRFEVVMPVSGQVKCVISPLFQLVQ
jgi:hypothetical protein